MHPLFGRWSASAPACEQQPQEPAGEAPQKPGLYAKLIGIAIGVALFLHGGLNVCIYQKFTPVYTATECGNINPTLDDFQLGVDSIHVGLLIRVSCTNPNPYRIQILASTPGEVFIGKDSIKVGTLTVVPGSYLEEKGGGEVRVRMSADIQGDDSATLLPHFLQDAAIPITMRLQFDVGISIPFGPLLTFETAAPFKKDCGMNMKGILVNSFVASSRPESRLGPLVCRESMSDLVIPEVGDEAETPADGNMGFTAAQVAPLEVARGELLKNVSLGLVITLSYLFAVLVPIHFWTVGPKCPTGCTGCLTGFAAGLLQRCRQQRSDDRALAKHSKLDLVVEREPASEQEQQRARLLGDLEGGT